MRRAIVTAAVALAVAAAVETLDEVLEDGSRLGRLALSFRFRFLLLPLKDGLLGRLL